MATTRSRFGIRISVFAIVLVAFSPFSVGPAAAISDLAPGDTGADVVELQTELKGKGFFRGAVTGTYDPTTESAVMALTKELGVSRSGAFSVALWDDLQRFPGPWIPLRDESDRLEVNLTKQVMYLIRDDAVEAIFPISSGRPGYQSPPGDYTLFFHDEGWTGSVAGRGTYNDWYYTSGLSVHGYHSVPSYPYSHGCIRVQYWDSDYLETRLFLTMPIHLWYEPSHYEKASLTATEPAYVVDDLLSVDQQSGVITPLRLLVDDPDGKIVIGGDLSRVSVGFDIAWADPSSPAVTLYDRSSSIFHARAVGGSGSTSFLFQVTGTRNWSHVVQGDYNGDGATDVLFYRATDGLMRFYTMLLDGRMRAITPAMTGNQGWTEIVPGDFDEDGRDEILWYRASDGLMRIYEISASGAMTPVTAAMHGTRYWTRIPSGDFNGDGTDDLLFYRASDGLYRFYTLRTAEFESMSPAGYISSNWSQILTGTFDDTAGEDLVFYKAGSILAGRFESQGVAPIAAVSRAPADQVLVTVDWD